MRFLAEAAWDPTDCCPAKACAGKRSMPCRREPKKADVEVDFDPRRGGRLPFPKPAPNPNATQQVVEMILEAERPILMPGGGVIIAEASEELVEFAEYLQVPVNPTYMGKGAIREDHPLYAGIVGLQT